MGDSVRRNITLPGDVDLAQFSNTEDIGGMTSCPHTKPMKLVSSIATASVIGASMFIAPPAADAKEHHHHHHHHRHHELRRIHREFRHDVREFNHYQRAYNRDWRHARRVYNREVYGYPRVIPAYGYNHRHPGFGIQISF